MRNLLIAILFVFAGVLNAQTDEHGNTILPTVTWHHGTQDYVINGTRYTVPGDANRPLRVELAGLRDGEFDWSWADQTVGFNPAGRTEHRQSFNVPLTRNNQQGFVRVHVTNAPFGIISYRWGTQTSATSTVTYFDRNEIIRDAQDYVDVVAGREVYLWEISDIRYTARIGTTTLTTRAIQGGNDNNIFQNVPRNTGTRIYHDLQDEIRFEFRFSSVVASTVPNFTQADWDNALTDPTFEFDFPSEYNESPSVNVIRQAVRVRRGHLDDTSTRTPLQDVVMTESISNSNYMTTNNCIQYAGYHDHFVSTLGSSLTVGFAGEEYTFITPTNVSYTIIVNANNSISAGDTVLGAGGLNTVSFCANEITDWLLARD